MRWFGIAVIWSWYAGRTLAVAAGTAIGGVVFALPGALHGVHSGDLAALVVCTLGAGLTTSAVRREWASRPRE